MLFPFERRMLSYRLGEENLFAEAMAVNFYELDLADASQRYVLQVRQKETRVYQRRRVLHCIVLCCSVLYCVAVSCNVLQCVVLLQLQCIALCCSVYERSRVLHCIVSCCSELQCVACRFSVLLQCVAVFCCIV